MPVINRPFLRSFAIAPALTLAATTVVAQGTAPTETGNADPGYLMMFTLGAALLIGVGLLVLFLRKRSNRDAMRRLNNE
jgi:hypothetical protein